MRRIAFARRAGRGNLLEVCLHCSQIPVLVGVADRLERTRAAERREPVIQAPGALDHPGIAGVNTEEDQTPAGVVGDRLVVDQRAAELHQPGEHRHVVRLSLDDMREVDVGRLRPQQLDRDLLDREDQRGVVQALLDPDASRTVLLIAVGADR